VLFNGHTSTESNYIVDLMGIFFRSVFAKGIAKLNVLSGDRVFEEGGGKLGSQVTVEEHAGRVREVLDAVVLALHGGEAAWQQGGTRVPLLCVNKIWKPTTKV
jgi:hypothetical protein